MLRFFPISFNSKGVNIYNGIIYQKFKKVLYNTEQCSVEEEREEQTNRLNNVGPLKLLKHILYDKSDLAPI